MADQTFAGLDDAVGDVLHQNRQNTAVQVRNNIVTATGTNADQEAGYKHLAAFAGVPVETVRADPKAIQQQANAQRVNADALASDFPHTAAFLSNTDNAMIAHDDVPATSLVEQGVKQLPPPPPAAQAPSFGDVAGNYGMAAVQGLGGAFNKAAGSAGMVVGGAASIYDKVASLISGRQTTAAGDAAFRAFVDPNLANAPAFNLRQGAGFGEKATSTATSLLGMLSQITLGGTAGEAPAAAATVPALLKGAVEHGTKAMLFPALSDAVDTSQKVYAATGDGAAAARAATAQYATSTLGGIVPLGAQGNLATRLVSGAAAGTASGELTHQIMNIAMPDSMQAAPLNAEDRALNALAGSILSGVMGPRAEPAYHDAVRQTVAEAQKADAAATVGKTIEALGQVSAASKLRERDPQAFRDFVQKVTDDGHLQDVYIDAKTLDEAFAQSGVTRADLDRTIPEVAEQLHEALQTNGDVRIPVADYATHIAGGPIDQAILPHLKAEPNGMTYKEGQEYQAGQAEQMKTAADKIAAAKVEDDAQQAQSQHVYDNILGQLTAANRFRPDVNQAYAAMTRDFYVTQAERAGITPAEMLERHPLRIGAENVAGGLSQGASLDTLRASLDAAGVDHTVSEKDGVVTLSKLVVPEGERNAGKGSAAMREITDYADRTGQHVALSPSADFGGNQKKLIQFYKRFGFVQNKGKNRAFSTSESMYRQAEGKTLYQSAKPPVVHESLDENGLPEYHGPDGLYIGYAHPTERMEFIPTADDQQMLHMHIMDSNTGKFLGEVDLLYMGGKLHGLYDIEVNHDARKLGVGKRTVETLLASQPDAKLHISNVVPEARGFWDRVGVPEQNLPPGEAYDGQLDWNTFAAARGRSDAGAAGGVAEAGRGAPGDDHAGADRSGAGEGAGTAGPGDRLEQSQRGAFDPQSKTIALLKGADLSTYLHESGHFFLDTMADMAARPDAPAGIKQDMQTLLESFGVKGTPDTTALDEWHRMSVDEQREAHETFARGFEKYLMEGKAPSVELQSLFSRFRSWLVNVYKSLTSLNVELSPEVKGVMDRMLATDEAIRQAEQVRGYAPLFESAEAAGMTPEEYAKYQQIGVDATAEATSDLEAKSMKDMKWLAGAKKRAVKGVNKDATEKRAAIRRQATRDVMSQPVRQAEQFLAAKGSDFVRGEKEAGQSHSVNPEKDNIFEAIAKLGGLDRGEVESQWGLKAKEHPESGIFGKPVVRKKGGLSFDAMAERLVDEGYLLPDEHGKADPAKLEELFHDQLAGIDRYSIKRDMAAAYGDEPNHIPEVPEFGAGKLRTSDVKEMFGDAEARELSQKRMTSNDGGLHPDIVGEMFGFEDGRDLVKNLLEAGSAKDAVDALTDQRMLERHGELTDPASIERLAEASIHNEARARFIATELKALAKALGPARALAEAAKQAAEASIAAKRIRDLRPAQYTAAEARAARNAEKAMGKADTQAAAVEKRAQLLNNRLAKTAADAVTEVQKAVDYLKKFDRPTVREKIELEYRDQIDALLDRFDLRTSTTATELNKREALLAFVERMSAAGYEPQIPERLLDEAQRQHYKDMKVEDFRGLVDAVKSIEHLGRLKQTLLDGKEARDIAAVAKEVKDTTATLPQHEAESNRGLSFIEQKWLSAKSAGRSMTAALLKMEQMMDWLDARNPNGPLNRVVFRRIADAGVHEYDLQAKVKAELDKLLETHLQDVTKDKDTIFTAPGLIDGLTGKPQRFTKKEMLALAGNMGNDSNLAKLAAGEKWDPAQVWSFLHKNMSKADWDFVAGLGRTLEGLWPEKVAMSRRLGNTNPDKIAPRPFDTPHGRYDGWYWPMIYDPARAQDVADRGAKSADALFENTYARANTDTGRTNTRNENYARPVLLSLDVIPRVIKDEIHDIAYREAIIDADKFLSNKTVRDSIVSALSQEHYDQLRPWLQSIANDRKVDMQALKWFDRVAHGARTRATIVGLGYRISTMLVHGSSAAMESIAELGPKWMGKGMADFANPAQWSANRDFIFERSGEMRNRMNEVDRDVREHIREIDLRLMDSTAGAVARGADTLKAHAYQGIAMLDMASALPTWMGAYHKGMAPVSEGGLGLSEADAVYQADKVVRNAHGGTGIKDLAAVQRGPEFFKLFTMFYTFWNHNVNRLMDTARRAKDLPNTFRNGEQGQFSGDLATVVMRTLVYTLGVQAMHSMLHPAKDDETGETNWLAWAGKEFTAAAFAGIPILRDVAAHYLTGKDYSATPAAGMVGAIGQSGKDAMDAMAGNPANAKWLKHTVTTAGYVFGLPLGQPASAAQFLWDVAAGDQNPETAGDWLRGVLHGDMKKH